MKKRQSRWRGDLDALDDFWDELWSAIAERTSAALSGSSTMPPPVPVFTISVTTTILSTTFVTVPYSSGDSEPPPATLSSTTSSSTSDSTSTSSSSSSSSSLTTTNLETALPPIVTPSSQVELPPLATASPSATSPGSSASNETSNSMIGTDSESQSQKKAVVGGLSGSIAGLIFIGVLICLILRIRRKKHEPQEEESFDATSEKHIRPIFFRTWTGITTAGSRDRPRTAPPRPESTASVTVDEDHRIIRMNTRHWPRPFAPGAGEGYRDSVPHGQLRVMNPDRPNTPRRSSETPSSFLRKQRSALTGLVFGTPRSSQSREKAHHRRAHSDIPTITVVDPALSRECIAPYARTPSFKSYPSINTLSVVRQEPPDDPFVTQPPASQPRPRRPSVTSSLQTTATRTWSHLLHPFRHNATAPGAITNVRGASHFSISTSNSSSRRSDPFDLSVRGGTSPRMGSEFARRGSGSGGWILYEGT